MYEKYSRLVRRASLLAVGTALCLILIKSVAWWQTGSVSILASIIDSLLDLLASFTSMLILRFSLMPADDNHSFGHGKAESLATLIQGAFISGSAILLLLQGVERVINPQPLQAAGLGMAVTVLTLLMTLGLIRYQRYVIKKTQSPAIKADQLHYQTDLLMNVAVLLSLGLSAFGYVYADGIFALAISVYILISALKMLFEAVQLLLDRALPDSEIELIWKIVSAQDNIIGVHDLRTRRSGAVRFIQLHLELDDHLPLWHAHQITDNLENRLLMAFPMSDIIIHQEPTSVVQQELQARQK
ncbi:cation diffusion facilitator family transporter [Testudinibacter sp. TR-2022]|uniref:cation diffusion facilitator family transporter n=1 Tax=Testudinibacter sp. TR-2022 TaxID=2585029 RepID=UPI0011189B89|nr:cation diffusion facilitator family transporter [Testudinibacter sp. TR-2022]TNH02585.1 cation diffusion facilitator family transporter [Pasteurellaceae bacterium Phil31]TNH08393.1 cation diffusion facilitator family transporter [Testudinibacter sp. TR-2022]TNH09138.1 cation diffusion facilitator family transporter [Testudinibacter sp. TR-2022]TNH12874.1 cation diffusion facilitator family transporter [Testudinibacter sp. TR-2022]TNH18082.1 cation diffusion facilitator family transporter [T